ncbi:proteasome regulatory particle subunit [Glugoides intestinalis]
MEKLFERERIARINGDLKELEEVHSMIISLCSNNDEIIHTLRLLVNKRKQEPECIKKLIKTVLGTHNDVPFLKNLLIKVIEGRMFLEEERLSIADQIKIALRNNIQESYDLIKEIPVETFTTVSDKKKNAFLFEQLRLALLLHCLEDAELITRKVRRSTLMKDELAIFLNYSILLRAAQNRFLDAANLFLELNEIDESKKHVALGSLYCLLSSCLKEERNIVEEKRKLLKRFSEFKNNDESMRHYLKQFNTGLIIEFDVVEQIAKTISKYDESVDKALLHRSVMEHNFFVVSKFFSKVKISQIAQLMHVREDDLVAFASEMVNAKLSTMKIDQQLMLIFFEDKKWNDRVDSVLDKIILANHLIHKQSISDNIKQ